MKTLKQIAAVTGINLRSLPQRLGSSVVIVVGIGGVVAVLVAVLAMVAGMLQTMHRGNQTDRVIVMRSGSVSEVASLLSNDAARVIADAPTVKRDGDGRPLVSLDALRPVKVVRLSDGAPSNAVFRGVSEQWQQVRPEIRIVSGRMFTPAVNEVIVGKSLASHYKGLELGGHFVAGSATWTVAGVFTSGGDSHESEILGDAHSLMSAFRRDGYNSATVLLKSPQKFDELAGYLEDNPRVSAQVVRESEYYARQSQTMTSLAAVVAYLIGSIMAVGAIFGALNTMYTAVSNRAREIATLRALGFGSIAMVISVLAEAVLLALIGGAIGAFISWALFNHSSASTISGSMGTQFVFDIAVTGSIVAVGLAWAAVIGVIGGLFPAVRAARLPVAVALRSV
jgi:putative ABC transport system permease protein